MTPEPLTGLRLIAVWAGVMIGSWLVLGLVVWGLFTILGAFV